MWPEDLFYFILEDLADELAEQRVSEPQPMPCDRWLARSCLQKSIRRGEVDIALQALATLLAQRPAGVWRALVIIALEDVGVAGMDTVGRVVAAGRNKAWRRKVGGEWVVASALVRRMAEDQHCQAACDLLMRVLNDPTWEPIRLGALEAEAGDLVAVFGDEELDLGHRAAAALALGGGLAEEQRYHQPSAVFDVLATSGQSPNVIAAAHAAWRISRNEMAFLLPLVWTSWLTKCLACGLIMQADLAMIARVTGPDTSLWNRRPRCRKLGCGGRVQFQAKAPGMQWHEALETPDAREP